ncbi:MFS transporter [Phenylobacterium sp.]|uniref:MFS transporter n=1 Tax=Phenylobacterium sp. TaxID=1871053 RepID=UPI0025ECA3DD|nr:MFS transporter [Phenylobacterium sp.]
MSHAAGTPPPTRLPLPRVWAFATGSIPVYMLLLVLGTYITPFYAGTVGIKLGVLGATLSSLRLIDVGFDFALGWVMDRFETPFGRFKPWFVLSLPVFWLGIYMLLNPPPGAGLEHLVPWLLVCYLAYSLLGLSHAAWAANLATDYHERSRIFGWTQGIAVIGSVGLLAAPILTHGWVKPGDGDSMPRLALLLIAVATVTIPINAIFTPERVVRGVKGAGTSFKDLAAIFTTGSMSRLVLADLLLTLGANTTAPMYVFFFHTAKGFEISQVSYLLIPYVGAGILGAPTWAHIANRFGKHRAIQIACVAYAITQSVLMAIPAGLLAATAVGMFFVGFSASAFIPMMRSMVADVTDELRLTTGKERAGVLYSLVILVQKVGTSVTAIIVLPILEYVGFNPKPHAYNTPEAIFGLQMCYLFAPVIFVLIGGLVFFGYKLTPERHSEIAAALKAQQPASLASAEESFAGPGEAPLRPAE